MRRFRFLACLSFLIVLAAVSTRAGEAAAQHAPAVQGVLDRARAASGARAWAGLRGLHEVGTENGVPYQRWVDAVRYGERLETGPRGAGWVARGYNGYGAWWLPGRPRDETRPYREVLAGARTEAFLAAYGYYFPGRFDLRSGYVGAREAGGGQFTVVWVQPAGGQARDLWFDRRTGLLGRIVERGVPNPRTLELSDYRRVGRLLLPFRQVTYGGGLARPVERVASRIEAVTPDRALFSLPRPG